MKNIFRRVLNGLANLNAIAAGIALILMIVHVSLNVVLRYFLNIPIDGTITAVTLFYMIAIVFLPLGYTELRDGHISVDILYNSVPAVAKAILRVFASLLSTVVVSVLAVRTLLEALTQMRLGAFVMEAGHKILTWPSYFLLPIGFAIMAIVLTAKLAGTEGKHPADEADSQPIVRD